MTIENVRGQLSIYVYVVRKDLSIYSSSLSMVRSCASAFGMTTT